jgi:hypothetical protein
MGFARYTELRGHRTAMSLTSHRKALSMGAIHHWLRTEYRGRVPEQQMGKLADIVKHRINLGQCNIRLKFVNSKPVVLSDRTAEEVPTRKGVLQ